MKNKRCYILLLPNYFLHAKMMIMIDTNVAIIETSNNTFFYYPIIPSSYIHLYQYYHIVTQKRIKVLYLLFSFE